MQKKLIDYIKALLLPIGGAIMAGVVAYSAYNVDQALHDRDFQDLTEEVIEMDTELEAEIVKVRAVQIKIIGLENELRILRTELITINNNYEKLLRSN